MTDIVREIIERAKARIAEEYGLPDEVAELLGQVETEIRAEYRGERVYVSGHRVTPQIDARADAIAKAYLDDVPVEEIANRHGISRATIYRYLKRR